MKQVNNSFNQQVVEKGLTVGQYKGVYQAKRIMMKAGVPVVMIDQILLENKNFTKLGKVRF